MFALPKLKKNSVMYNYMLIQFVPVNCEPTFKLNKSLKPSVCLHSNRLKQQDSKYYCYWITATFYCYSTTTTIKVIWQKAESLCSASDLVYSYTSP